MKKFLVVVVFLLSGCSWFHGRKPATDTPELVVTGAPLGALILVDGIQVGDAISANDQSREIDVSAGDHTVEIKAGPRIVFHEQTYVAKGQKRAIAVLSGFQ